MAPTEYPVNAHCCCHSVVASNKSPTHSSSSCKKKRRQHLLQTRLRKEVQKLPTIFASPWLEDRADQLCGSKWAVCIFRAVLSSQRMEKFLFRRSGRGPRGVTQLWSYSCPAPRPGSCDIQRKGTHVYTIQTQGRRRVPM